MASSMIGADLLSSQSDWDRTPLGYVLIRLLFRAVTTVFYHEVETIGLENLPPDGVGTILCANHSNSLTDPTLLIASIPRRSRSMLRLTAKDTHFRQRTLASFLIENSGAIPLMRQKDHLDLGKKVAGENVKTFSKLIEGLQHGACVCLFPEGISRYFPTVARLKTGVARIAAEALRKEKETPSFQLAIVPISITYLHREKFRSNVLVRIGKPIYLTPGDNPALVEAAQAPPPADGSSSEAYKPIRDLTNQIEGAIRSGCLDAPSWRIMSVAHIARRLYAPGGPGVMSLADYVGITQAFCDIFGKAAGGKTQPMPEDELIEPHMTEGTPDKAYIMDLAARLTAYQAQLKRVGLKDYRINAHSELGLSSLSYRLTLRIILITILTLLASPGLLLWLPILAVTKERELKFKKKGPAWDVYDELAQTKLIHGLVVGTVVYLVACLITLPFILFTSWLLPLLMWVSLRMLEDLVSAIRALRSLLRLLSIGPKRLAMLKATRDSLQKEVIDLAVASGLPEDFHELLGGPARAIPAGLVGQARNRLRYFSVKRRRAKDWNEAFRFSDISDYEDDAGTDVMAD